MTVAIRPKAGIPLQYSGFEDVEEFGGIDFDFITTLRLNPSEEIGEYGSFIFAGVPYRWSLEHLEARTDYDFPAVYVELSKMSQPVGPFPEGKFFERRLVEVPVLQEAELDSRFGLSGFQKVTIVLDNSDGLIGGLDLQDSFVRMFFADASGSVYREFNGKVADWSLSHRCTVSVEDVDAIAITQDLPRRTLNQLVEAEKLADANFANVVVANDLGNPIPVIFGRAVKVPLLYVKADETNREYDYIIGEGEGISGGFQGVFTVYREDQALDEINGTVAAATSTTLTLEAGDKRPESWYRYWWVEIATGLGAGQIRNVTAYDSANNRLTVPAWTTTPNAASTYRLREWRFYDGVQASPYAGYSFIRFKKRMGVSGRTDPIYADVNGLGGETNVARAVQSLLSNPDWGLGLDVDPASFDAAAALPEISGMLCEGAIIDTSAAVDYLDELLAFRDIVLWKDDAIKISVDQAKTAGLRFGLGDETGLNNIMNGSPEIFHVHPNEKVKNLKVRYRKNNKENDVYLHELERLSSVNGVDTTVNLPFVYDHATADRWLDYKRKRYAAAVKKLAIDAGADGRSAARGQMALITIPSLGVIAQGWEITGAGVTPAGANSLRLVPYSAAPYTYVPITSEGGTLPVDESLDIPPDYTKSVPDPVTGVAVSMQMGIVGFTAHPFALITWTPPEDNYGGAVVSVKLHTDPTTSFRAAGTYSSSARIEGLVPGQRYDFLVESLNVTGELKGLGVLVDNAGAGYVAGGDSTAPSTPTGLAGSSKFGKLIWTWNKNPEADVAYYEAELNTSTSGGVLGKEIIPHLNDADFKPRYELEIQTGDLTTSITRAVRVRAVDHSGNPSAWTTRIAATTGDVGRDDLRDNATMDIVTVQSASEKPGGSQSIGVWYTVLSTVITIDRTGIVKVRYNGQWVPTGSGFNLRLKRGAAVLKTFASINAVNKAPATILDERSTAAGTYTYTVETKSDVSGGIGLGLTDNTLSIQGDFK